MLLNVLRRSFREKDPNDLKAIQRAGVNRVTKTA